MDCTERGCPWHGRPCPDHGPEHEFADRTASTVPEDVRARIEAGVEAAGGWEAIRAEVAAERWTVAELERARRRNLERARHVIS